jgi:serine/threonine-protein kinase
LARKIGSRYTAQQVLGRGSAGTVWLGDGPEGPVAIKLLREDLAADQDLVGRFVQERTALLSLDHPHIVGIRDMVVDGTDLALVMDLVRGTDLRSRLERDRRLAPAMAVAITADVAGALAAAHAAGVVHRDVKPENVLLDSAAPAGPGGAPPALLTDFGIARLVDAPRRTRATRIIGTPDYLAPEIIEGLPPRASVDIYALATVLYELLAGATPFGGGHPGAVLRRHVTESVPPLPDLPDELWQALAQCLAKAPASRLTAAELAGRLRALLPDLAGLPPLDLPPDPDPEDAAEGAADDFAADEPSGAYRSHGGDAYGPARRRSVPLVRGAAPDSSRDTHTSLKLPTPAELAAGRPHPDPGPDPVPAARTPADLGDGRGAGSPAPSPDGALAASGAPAGSPAGPPPGEPHHRHRAPGRRRRGRIGAAVGAALVVAGLGGWAVAEAGGSGGGHGGGDPAPTPTPATSHTPGDGAESPQGARGAAEPETAYSGASGSSGASGTSASATGDAALPSWSAFTTLPAPAPGVHLAGGPRAVTVSGTTYVFARGADKSVWYWAEGRWQRLTGISTAADPAVVSASPGRLDLFALGTDHLLYRRTLTGGRWGEWYQVDERTRFDSAPAAASPTPGRIDLVARSGGDLLTASFENGRWNAWALVPTAGRITGDPGLVAGGSGSLDAFVVRRADHALLRLPWSGGGWRPAQRIPGVEAATRPAPARTPSGALYVAVSRTGGGLTLLRPTPAPTTSPVPAAPPGDAPAALSATSHHLTLWTITPSGRLTEAHSSRLA